MKFKNTIILSNILLISILAGCNKENTNQPSKIEIDKSKVTTEMPTTEQVTTEQVTIKKDKSEDKKDNKVDINAVHEVIKSMHHYKANDINLYPSFVKELKKQNVKMEENLSTPYTQFYNKVKKDFYIIRLGYLLSSDVKNENKNTVDFYVTTVNVKAAVPDGYTSGETAAKAYQILKNNPYKDDSSQTIHYQLKLNKDKTSGILKIDPKDKDWYKRQYGYERTNSKNHN